MLAVAGLLLAVAVAVVLAVLLVQARGRLDAATAELAEVRRARDDAEAARKAAEGDAATARKERDDALERERRARRDAADVAKRMKQEAEARAAADAARAETEAERERLAVELKAAEEAVASGSDEQVAELWSLAIAGARRTWEISVAPSPGMPCPLDDTDDELRTAVEIEVDAAREEAGADIELDWSASAVAPPAVAVRALSIVQELVARLSKTTEAAVLRVGSTADGVTIEVQGTDVEGHAVLPTDIAAEHQVEPGCFFLPA